MSFLSAAKSAIKSYEETLSTSLNQKFKNGLKKIGHKLLQAFEIE